ncbi:MAG TPA: hypothetical protein VHU22_25030 [Xanthobacteraceae bacterium]|jgi:uncharacterized membrane protein YkoI|nr:hypothetical protein [Xanthobacteraceae bacterium]
MSAPLRFAIGILFVLGVLPVFGSARGEDNGRAVRVDPARAEETTQTTTTRPSAPAANESGHACLDQRERRAEVGKLIPLAAAMRTVRARMPGSTVVRARLCRGSDGLVYVLTVLARDGKVARLTVDAVKGTLVGGL